MPFLAHIGLMGGAAVALQRIATQNTLVGDLLAFAVQWLVACALFSWLSWKVTLVILRRRGKPQPPHQGLLLFAIYLAACAAGNILIVGRSFLQVNPLAFVAVQALFLLFYLYFPNRRFAPLWTLWLTVIYTFSLFAAFIPQNQYNAKQQVVITSLVVAVVVGAIGDVFALLPPLLAILPQIALRFRRFAATSEPAPLRPLPQRLAFLAVVAMATLALFGLAGWLSLAARQTPPQGSPPAVVGSQLIFFLLASLIPIGVSYALLAGQRFDRQAIISRALVNGALALGLLVVYAVCVVALWFAFPGFRAFPIYGYLPFLTIIVILMARLFRPLQSFCQTWVDRRYYRERYDATQTLTTLGATLRDEVQLDALSKRFVATIEKAFQPSATTLWLSVPPSAQPRRPASALLAAPTDAGQETSARPAPALELAPGGALLHRQATATLAPPPQAGAQATSDLSLALDDPAQPALRRPSSVVHVEQLPAESSIGRTLRTEGVSIVLPLFGEGELIGLLTLGQRQSGRPYTMDDCEPIVALTDQITPVLRAAKQAHEQDVELRQRERIEQELQTARRIQEALLPKTVPALPGWRLATCYQPAREVGGDFYDFIPLPDGRLGIVLGDVTDKGMPAALVMATTRSMLRAVATQPHITPGQVLAQVNELLCPDLPASMFVTCFYAILDSATGALRFANAGQDLPYRRAVDGDVQELWAAGMPLGLMPGMTYDEHEATLRPGEYALLYSDGLVEAHSPEREMFGFPRLMALLRQQDPASPLIVSLLGALAQFTGADWEQEDDITLVALLRAESEQTGMDADDHQARAQAPEVSDANADDSATGNVTGDDGAWRTLGAWDFASEPGGEREAIRRVQDALQGLPLAPERLEDLKTAVGEATMNAMEHGNGYNPALLTQVEALASTDAVIVRITDQGGPFALADTQTPDLDAKLAGLQSPRGWGLYLIEQLVDEARVTGEGQRHTIELLLHLDHLDQPRDESHADT